MTDTQLSRQQRRHPAPTYLTKPPNTTTVYSTHKEAKRRIVREFGIASPRQWRKTRGADDERNVLTRLQHDFSREMALRIARAE